MKLTIVALALASVSTQAFITPAPLPLCKSSGSMQMKLTENDFIPSEVWMREYMGEQGLRYSMGKTPQEVEQEGDYEMVEAMFGQTCNTPNMKKLKAEATTAANTNKNKERSATWLEKYGYPRFFPAYIDKSGN